MKRFRNIQLWLALWSVVFEGNCWLRRSVTLLIVISHLITMHSYKYTSNIRMNGIIFFLYLSSDRSNGSINISVWQKEGEEKTSERVSNPCWERDLQQGFDSRLLDFSSASFCHTLLLMLPFDLSEEINEAS